jgi:hypothetical protein
LRGGNPKPKPKPTPKPKPKPKVRVSSARDQLGEHREDRSDIARIAALRVHDLVESLMHTIVRCAVRLVAGHRDVQSLNDEVGGQVLVAAKAIGADVDDEGIIAGIDRYGISATSHGGASLKEAELRSGNTLCIHGEAPGCIDACPAASDDGSDAVW